MSDNLPSHPAGADTGRLERGPSTLGASTMYNLLEAMIALTERNKREFDWLKKDLRSTREDLQNGFNNFAHETQKAYQQMRKELHGEKRISLALLNELLEIGQDLEQIVASRPKPDGSANTEGPEGAFARWADSIEVESRKVQAALLRHGIHPYDAVVGSPYNPALHERVGSKKVEGLGPL